MSTLFQRKYKEYKSKKEEEKRYIRDRGKSLGSEKGGNRRGRRRSSTKLQGPNSLSIGNAAAKSSSSSKRRRNSRQNLSQDYEKRASTLNNSLKKKNLAQFIFANGNPNEKASASFNSRYTPKPGLNSSSMGQSHQPSLRNKKRIRLGRISEKNVMLAKISAKMSQGSGGASNRGLIHGGDHRRLPKKGGYLHNNKGNSVALVKPNQSGALEIERFKQGYNNYKNQKKRNQLMKKINEELDKNYAVVPSRNSYLDGPSMKDDRRSKAEANRRDAIKEWEEFFGEIVETRWDNFEDFLYLMAQKYVADDVDLLKFASWDQLFLNLYKQFAKPGMDNSKNLEVAEVPYIKNFIFRGKVVDKNQWCLMVANTGIKLFFKKHASKTVERVPSTTPTPTKADPHSKPNQKPKKSSLSLFQRFFLKNIKYTYSCNSVYEGDFKHGKRHGFGILRLSSGGIYEGDFKANFRHGTGVMKHYSKDFKTCLVYDGDWEFDLKHGFGELSYPDGTTYSGQWKHGKQLYGTFRSAKGHRYMGFWDGKLMDKQGVYYDPKGRIYKGEFEKGKFKGEGEMKQGAVKVKGHFDQNQLNREGVIEKDGYTYTGEIIRQRAHGFGKKVYKNGDVYEGYFKSGKETGKGVYRKANGFFYNGRFKDGLFEGQGSLIDSKGNQYEGAFKKGKMEGFGKYLYREVTELRKTEYEGDFRGNEPNGRGVLKFENGSVYRGEMKDGKMHGKGKMVIRTIKGERDSREWYEGQFEFDLFEGYGVMYENHKAVYKGYWKYGMRHGKGEYLIDDGSYEYGLFCNNELLNKDVRMI